MGLVAQRIRARGYEPRCRGFESLLAHNRPKREGPFPPGGRKIMLGIAIADSKLWNLGGWVFCRNRVEWPSFLFEFIYLLYLALLFFLHIVFFTGRISIFFEAP